MLNDNLVSLIKADKMLVNVKIHMTFALRLFWTVIIAFLILFFINIYHKQHIVINLFITIAVFLPLMWSIIRRRTQNKKIRSRYPYAFKSVVESYGLELVQGKGLSLVDTYLLSGYDERIFLCMEEMHKYQEDHQHPISPLLYKKKHYSKEEYDKEWNMILYNIRKVEGEDVIYTEDQIGTLCEKYKVWSDISKRMLTESWGVIFHDMSFDKEYSNQFLELLNRQFKDYTKKPDGLRDQSIIESEIDNSLLHFNYVLCPQFAYTHILRYVDMKNGGINGNEDFNRKNRRMQKVMSSLLIYLMVAVTIVGGLFIWTATGTFGIGFVSAIGIGFVCMLLYLLYRLVLEHLLTTKFKNHPTIMASIATMEGINPDKVLNSTSDLTESEIWKLLLADGDLFKYPPLIIKPIRNSFVTLLENYPNGVQKALDFLSKELEYQEVLVVEKSDKKRKRKETIIAQDFLCNMLDEKTFTIVLTLLDKEKEIKIYEANYDEAKADEQFINQVNEVFENAIEAYLLFLSEWNYEIHTVNYSKHNYDGTISIIELKFFEVIYDIREKWEINNAYIKTKLEISNKLEFRLDFRLCTFCDLIAWNRIFVIKDENDDEYGIDSIGSILINEYKRLANKHTSNFCILSKLADSKLSYGNKYFNNSQIINSISELSSLSDKELEGKTIFSIKDYRLCTQIGWFHEGDEKEYMDEEELDYVYWPNSHQDELFCEGNNISPYSRCLKYHFETLSLKKICSVGITYSKFKYSRPCIIKEDMKDSWQLLKGAIRSFSLYSYIPVSHEKETGFELTEDEKKKRRAILHFKKWGIDDSTMDVYNDLKTVLMESFVNLEHAMFFFVPSNQRSDYEKRHKTLSKLLMKDLQVSHSFGLVGYNKDGRSARDERGSKSAELYWCESFFKNKQIIMFDDIITSGHTMLHYKEMLERWGAKVIACIALGKTHYSHVAHPIDELKNIQNIL